MQSKSKLKIGLIGYGFIGKTHAPNIINNPNATLHSIFSAPEDKDSIPTGVKFFDDWKALIDDPDVDAVVIVTPTFTHREIAIYAAQKKKHIFLEKPMARTTKECQDIIDACKAEGVKLFIGHVLRFWPSYVQAKTMMKNVDTFGTLKNSRLRRISLDPAGQNGSLTKDYPVKRCLILQFMILILPLMLLMNTEKYTVKPKKVKWMVNCFMLSLA